VCRKKTPRREWKIKAKSKRKGKRQEIENFKKEKKKEEISSIRQAQ